MNQIKKIFLKKGREKSLLNGHPWVFSGAIDRTEENMPNGSLVYICDNSGQRLATGYYNSKTSISARILGFGGEVIDRDFFSAAIRTAQQKRKSNPLLQDGDSYRLIFSEGDGLPGLVVDKFGDHLTVQYFTLGMENLKNELNEILIEEFRPASIFEKSDHDGRSLEGLAKIREQIHGFTPDNIVMHENGLKYLVSIKEGQKTGFFLDQRENRKLVRSISRERKVLNLFSYSGAFDVCAASGGARAIISVDSSEKALDLASQNLALNGGFASYKQHCQDAFQYLHDNPLESDFIILDPPALIKKREDLEKGLRAYKDLNLTVMKKCPSMTLLLTFSCSRFMDMDLFQKVLYGAARDAHRKVSIIGRYSQSPDHPVNIFCPETDYLKGLLLLVE